MKYSLIVFLSLYFYFLLIKASEISDLENFLNKRENVEKPKRKFDEETKELIDFPIDRKKLRIHEWKKEDDIQKPIIESIPNKLETNRDSESVFPMEEESEFSMDVVSPMEVESENESEDELNFKSSSNDYKSLEIQYPETYRKRFRFNKPIYSDIIEEEDEENIDIKDN